MAKLLHTDLLGDEIPAQPHAKKKGVKPSVEKKAPQGKPSKGKKLYYAVFGAILVIALAIGGYLIITSFFEDTAKDIVEKAQIPFKPPDGMATPDQQQPGETPPEGDKPPKATPDGTQASTQKQKSGGLNQMPWIGAFEKLIGALAKTDVVIYSITSGPEGWVFIAGKTDGKISKTIIPGYSFDEIEIIESTGSDNQKKFLAKAKLAPIEKIEFDPEPVPPYERGALIRKLESLTRENELSNSRVDAVKHEKIPDGSRYLISVTARGKLDDVVAFTKSVMNLEMMIEIGKLSIESLSDGPLGKGDIRLGIIYRAYHLPKIKEPSVEEPLATEL